MAERENRESIRLRGIGVSPGVVTGPVFVMVSEALQVVERSVPEDRVEHEVYRLENALIETRRQIRDIQRDLESQAGVSDASIFDAHLMVLDDRTFIEEVLQEIRNRHVNTEAAVRDVGERYAQVLASVKDEYLRERVSDVKDVVRRILRNLFGNLDNSISKLTKRHIVVARDLAPSDTAVLRKDLVSAFATDLGSPTSHTAVMARALEIPAVVGLRDISQRVNTGNEILIDGNKGVLIIHPTPAELEEYGKVEEARRSIQKGLTSLQHEPAETTDHHRIVLSANAESADEVDAVLQYGAEGIGLFRSEYLYLARDGVVSEDEQAEVYSEVARRLAPAPVIIRTLDLGGDKFFRDERMPGEANPFLGCRSIRLSLLYPDSFKAQLRAILKASACGNIKIMYPMISRVSELLGANRILDTCKQELDSAGVDYDSEIEVGIMVEVPSAALTADALAVHADFLSIGTNDLVQYTLAVDRVNERVAYLYEPTHPAVLELISRTVQAGHRHGRWVGLCGEMAADPLVAPLLVGLGIDELSMAPSAVPWAKDAIRSVSQERAKALAEACMGCESAADVLRLCRDLTKEVAPELLELI